MSTEPLEWEPFPDDVQHWPSVQKFMAASHNRKMILKLRALQSLSHMVGLYPNNDDEAAQNLKRTPALWVIYALHTILTQSGTPIERAYCAALLDFMSLTWRNDFAEAWPGFAVERGDPVMWQWRKAVFKRDQRTCQHCGSSKNQLHAHHIVHWADCVYLRADVDNGVTLCKSCHVRTHSENGSCGPIKSAA